MKMYTKSTIMAAVLMAVITHPVKAGITPKQVAGYVAGAVALGAAGYYVWSTYFAYNKTDTQTLTECQKRSKAAEKRLLETKHPNATRLNIKQQKKNAPSKKNSAELLQTLPSIKF